MNFEVHYIDGGEIKHTWDIELPVVPRIGEGIIDTNLYGRSWQVKDVFYYIGSLKTVLVVHKVA